MIRRRELYDRECVAGLIHVIEQVPLRAAVRRPLAIHRSSVGLLLLWSVLRWERTFLIKTLERLGVDLWALTRNVDEALTLCSKEARETGVRTSSDDLDPFLRGWLNRAAEQARALHHDFLGGEHLLLALLADGDSELAVTIFRRNGLGYDALKRAVVDGLRGGASPDVGGTRGGLKSTLRAASPQAGGPDGGLKSTPQADVLELVLLDDDASDAAESAVSQAAPAAASRPPAKPEAASWIADIDRPAVGVPRRFGVFLMMLMVTLYAVLFSVLRWLQASNLVFGLLALLFTGIGIGQAVLFGGRYPRSASIWIGSILVPIEVCVFIMNKNDFLYVGAFSGMMAFVCLLLAFLLSIPFGALFGYLFGTVTAGGFWLVDLYEKRQAAKEPSGK